MNSKEPGDGVLLSGCSFSSSSAGSMRGFRGRLRSDADRAMIAGHFGFAAAVKSREQQTALWALMLACQWIDVVFVPLFLLGVVRIGPVPGTDGGYG